MNNDYENQNNSHENEDVQKNEDIQNENKESNDSNEKLDSKENKKEENKKENKTNEEKKDKKEDTKKDKDKILEELFSDENSEKKLKVNFKNIVLILFVIVLIISLPNLLSTSTTQTIKEVSYTEFINTLKNGNILRVEEKEDYLYAYDDVTKQKYKTKMITYRISQDEKLMKIIDEKNIDVISLEPDRMPLLLTNIFLSWSPMILLIVVWIFLLNRMNRGNSNSGGPQIFNIGKSKTKDGTSQKVKVTFNDVAGADEAKVELQEIVEFLKEPKKFLKAGAKIPKGVLLMGAPGTGKTLLAKAVAGEANVPFFSISGSEFVEMFVGVGASRVRDLFGKARKNAPCIVFIDEIDAVGRKRGSGQGGGNDEREQTLNQLLVEMDGFGNDETIIVIAATNRPEILDKALMRPGRFDRQVVVDRPDKKGREEILKVHSKNKKLAEDVDLQVVARKTPGFVGADLANLLNEAAILAARDNRVVITMADLEEASEKVSIGPERKSRLTIEKEKYIVAYHEVGHTLVQWMIPHTDPVHKVTIVPRGMAALGYTMSLPTEDKYLKSKNEYLSELQALLGGRAAEELVFGDITTGASNDIERATKMALAMVTRFGMVDKFGPLMLDDSQEGEWFKQRIYSEDTAKLIDAEVKKLINDAYNSAKKILSDNIELLEKISLQLLEKETIMSEELEEIIGFPQVKEDFLKDTITENLKKYKN
ncbi:cell division protease FtsH [Hypnocyclicus thermotrophus]|uniref:ATP-dependent zinc metalloprotease FtsH n=1 Tax=Hypnocyclicus thermotrophus TaxID=1627895 RepID=A0AA46I593_9FUSO|nr:ATP-dependent zinc metalloprotease FtsH [Hypnocyclicus thermotrophus]TDT68635.1 cell division protease FtsH [Hypnocyclicus thermotrophus]